MNKVFILFFFFGIITSCSLVKSNTDDKESTQELTIFNDEISDKEEVFSFNAKV